MAIGIFWMLAFALAWLHMQCAANFLQTIACTATVFDVRPMPAAFIAELQAPVYRIRLHAILMH
jgi:hypothetical protein